MGTSLVARGSGCRRTGLAVEALEARLTPASAIDTSPDVRFAIENNWGSGLQAQMTIVNHQSAPLTDWRLEFDSPLLLNSVWDGKVLSHTGQHYVVGNAGYNSTIP